MFNDFFVYLVVIICLWVGAVGAYGRMKSSLCLKAILTPLFSTLYMIYVLQRFYGMLGFSENLLHIILLSFHKILGVSTLMNNYFRITYISTWSTHVLFCAPS